MWIGAEVGGSMNYRALRASNEISYKARPLMKSVTDVIHSKCINRTNFMSGIDVYVYYKQHSNFI